MFDTFITALTFATQNQSATGSLFSLTLDIVNYFKIALFWMQKFALIASVDKKVYRGYTIVAGLSNLLPACIFLHSETY